MRNLKYRVESRVTRDVVETHQANLIHMSTIKIILKINYATNQYNLPFITTKRFRNRGHRVVLNKQDVLLRIVELKESNIQLSILRHHRRMIGLGFRKIYLNRRYSFWPTGLPMF